MFMDSVGQEFSQGVARIDLCLLQDVKASARNIQSLGVTCSWRLELGIT